MPTVSRFSPFDWRGFKSRLCTVPAEFELGQLKTVAGETSLLSSSVLKSVTISPERKCTMDSHLRKFFMGDISYTEALRGSTQEGLFHLFCAAEGEKFAAIQHYLRDKIIEALKVGQYEVQTPGVFISLDPSKLDLNEAGSDFFKDIDLKGVNLEGAKLEGIRLTDMQLRESQLKGALFRIERKEDGTSYDVYEYNESSKIVWVSPDKSNHSV